MEEFSIKEPLTPNHFVEHKINFYMENKTRITFRLKDMPEYFFTGIIESKDILVFYHNGESSIGSMVLVLDNGEKMLFVNSDILTSSIHPASIQPIKSFERTNIREEIRKEVFDRCNNVCEIQSEYCTNVATEIDHIIPVSKGGSNELYNLQGACSVCNKSKSNKV